MNILFLTDLHWGKNPVLDDFKWCRILEEDNIDAVIMLSDNATLSGDFRNHRELYSLIRNSFQGDIGFIVGNHELWGNGLIPSEELLEQVHPTLGQEYGFAYLEHDALVLDGITFVGSYSHYDYSLADPSIPVSNFISSNIANDVKNMDWQGKSNQEVCEWLTSRLAARMDSSDTPLISLSHTVPLQSMAIHHDERIRAIWAGFAGTTKLADMISQYQPEFHICGHTHSLGAGYIGNTLVVGPGSGNSSLGYSILNTESMELTIKYLKIK